MSEKTRKYQVLLLHKQTNYITIISSEMVDSLYKYLINNNNHISFQSLGFQCSQHKTNIIIVVLFL